MLYIIRQYKILFEGFIINNFAERTEFNGKEFHAKEFNKLDLKDRNDFVLSNLNLIKSYVNGLDKAKDGLIVSNLNDKGVDDFSGADFSENIANEKAFRYILQTVGLLNYDLKQGVNLEEIISLLDSFKASRSLNVVDTKLSIKELSSDTGVYDNPEKGEEKFLSNISKSKVQPSKGTLFGYEDEGKYVLEIDDYVFVGSDPTHTFNHVPSIQEIEAFVTNFNKRINLGEWDNSGDITDARVDESRVGKSSALLKKGKSEEDIKVSESSFAGMEFLRTDSEKTEYLEDTQLKKLLQKDSKTLFSLYSELQNALGTKGIFKFVDYGAGCNYSQIYPILEKYGYEVPTFGLSDKEANNIYTSLAGYINTQHEVVPKLSPEEKMKILLDFNKDGNLTTGMDEASIGEAQALYKILESPSSDGFEQTIRNLGFASSSELFAKMETNLYSTREAFQDAIRATLKTGELSVTTRNGAPAKMGLELMKRNAQMQKDINRNVDLWFNRSSDVSKLEYIGNMKRESFLDKIKSILTPDSLGFGVLDDQKMKEFSAGGGLGYNINLQNITFGILDSFSLGFSSKGAGWAISKDLLAPFREYMGGYKASLTVALANGIPMASASVAVIDQANVELKSLSQQEMDTKTTTSLGGSVGPGFIEGDIKMAFRNENTVAGIEEMTNSYEQRLENNKASILKGVPYETSGFKTKDSTDYDKQMYNLIVNMFKQETDLLSEPQKAEYLDKLFLPKFVQSYKDRLYKNNDGGFDFSLVTAGTLIIPGALVPYIVAGGEYKKSTTTEVNRNLDIQEQVNYKKMDASVVGLTLENIDGKKVFKIPSTFTTKDGSVGKYQISSSLEIQEGYERDGFIYIGGNISSKDIKFLDHISSNDVTRTIVIGQGVKDTDKDSDNYGLYLPTKLSGNILNGVNVSELSTPKVSEVLGSDIESFKESEPIANILNSFVSRSTLSDKRTIGMLDLQRSIFNFRKIGDPSMEICYSKYLSAISHPGFREYIIEKSGGNESSEQMLDELIKQSNSPNLSNSVKLFILQSMANNFMKPNKLNFGKDGNTKLKNGDIRKYDKSRDSIFDKMITRELGESMAGKIREAKSRWNEKYGNNDNFENVSTGSGTLGLTTNAYKRNVNGLLPLSGMFNVVGFAGKPAVEKIEGLSLEEKSGILKSLGNNILQSYANQINSHGYNLDESSVIDFIINGGDGKTKIDMNTFFVKNSECLNDCIILNLNLNIEGKYYPLTIGSTGTTSVGIVENSHLNFLGAGSDVVDTKKPKPIIIPEKQPEKLPEKLDTKPKETINPEENPIPAPIITAPKETIKPEENPTPPPVTTPGHTVAPKKEIKTTPGHTVAPKKEIKTYPDGKTIRGGKFID